MEAETKDDDNEFYDIEMEVDKELFDDEYDSLEVGKFVSFRYASDFMGRPVNAKIS